eukprot:RCo016526
MARVCPLVIHTQSSIGEAKFNAPTAEMMRRTWLTPKKKYDEEMERQHYVQLRSTRDDVVVVFGNRVEHFKRRHIASHSKPRFESGFLSPPNKPYVSVGEVSVNPEAHLRKCRYVPEKLRRSKRSQLDKAREQGPEPEGDPGMKLYEDMALSESSPRSSRTGMSPRLEPIPGGGSSPEELPAAQARAAAHLTPGSSPLDISADRMLELLLTHPNKAQALKARQQKYIAQLVEQEDAARAAAENPSESAKVLPLLKLDDKNSAVRPARFPAAELDEA